MIARRDTILLELQQYNKLAFCGNTILMQSPHVSPYAVTFLHLHEREQRREVHPPPPVLVEVLIHRRGHLAHEVALRPLERLQFVYTPETTRVHQRPWEPHQQETDAHPASRRWPSYTRPRGRTATHNIGAACTAARPCTNPPCHTRISTRPAFGERQTAQTHLECDMPLAAQPQAAPPVHAHHARALPARRVVAHRPALVVPRDPRADLRLKLRLQARGAQDRLARGTRGARREEQRVLRRRE